MDQSNQIKYIVMQICYIPSIICSIFTLYHLLFNRHLRSTLHNHVPIALLIISTLDSLFNHPFTLIYLRMNRVIPSTTTMCLGWNFLNSFFTVATFLTMAWGSIERHFLIFNSNLFLTQRQRFVFHYIPLLTMIVIYPLISNIVISLLYPCENRFNFSLLFCGYTCALKIPSVALYARIAHNFLPISVVIGSTIVLIIRVIKQKEQIQTNQINWRRYRRMVIQLFSLASLFLPLTLPAMTVSIVQNCCLPTFASSIFVPYLNFLVRFLTLLLPFLCLSLFPELLPKLFFCKNNHVQPVRTIRARTLLT